MMEKVVCDTCGNTYDANYKDSQSVLLVHSNGVVICEICVSKFSEFLHKRRLGYLSVN